MACCGKPAGQYGIIARHKDCCITVFCLLLLSAAAMSCGSSGRDQCQGTTLPSYQHHEAVTSLAASQNVFTRDLYLKLAKKSGNLFFSPFSVMTALGMTYAGAGGNTEQEMRSVLHLSENKEVIHDAFQDVVSDIKTGAADYELRTSNMAYTSNKLSVLSQFENILKEKYLSAVKTVDFSAGEQVRQEINTQVEKDTNSRIKDLIPSGVLDSLTRMVLVNAVYFKGLWAKQFDQEETREREFWISSTESVKVPMMHKEAKFRITHNKDLESSILAMDYQGSRLSMVFVLPDKRDGLAEVESKLAGINLSDLDKNIVREIKIEVVIPKFKLEESLELVDYLKEMGMQDLFDGATADLSGISGNKDLFVSNVIHKAFLEVNEQGSEAAAATGVMIAFASFQIDQPTFIADHPFLFFIKDAQSNFILFSGRLVAP